MRRNTKNAKVLRAISIAIAVMIATSVMPFSVLAEDVTNENNVNENHVSENNENEDNENENNEEKSNANGSSGESQTVSSIISSLESDAEEREKKVTDGWEASYERAQRAVESGRATVRTIDKLAESDTAPETQIVVTTDVTYTFPAEKKEYVDLYTDVVNEMKPQFSTVTSANKEMNIEAVKQDLENVRKNLGEIKSADASAYQIQGQANNEIAKLEQEEVNITYADLAREISDSEHAVIKAIEDVKKSGSIDGVNAIVDAVTQNAIQAKMDYERRERAAVAAQSAYNQAMEALGKAESDYNTALSSAVENEGKAIEVYKAAYNEAKKLTESARALKKKADKAVEEAQKAVDITNEQTQVALKAAETAKNVAADFVTDTSELESATKTIRDYESNPKPENLEAYQTALVTKQSFMDKYETGLSDCTTSEEAYQYAQGLAQNALEEKTAAEENLNTINGYKNFYNTSLELAKEVQAKADKGVKDAGASSDARKAESDALKKQYESKINNKYSKLENSQGVKAARETLDKLQEKYESVQNALAEMSENYKKLTGMLEELKSVSAAKIAALTPHKQESAESDSGSSSSSSAVPAPETIALAEADVPAEFDLTGLLSENGVTLARTRAAGRVSGARSDDTDNDTDDSAQPASSDGDQVEITDADIPAAAENIAQESGTQTAVVTDSILPQADKPFEESNGMNGAVAGVAATATAAGAGALVFTSPKIRLKIRKGLGGKK